MEVVDLQIKQMELGSQENGTQATTVNRVNDGQTSSKTGNRYNNRPKGQNNRPSTNREHRSNYKQSDNDSKTCFRCGKEGHIASGFQLFSAHVTFCTLLSAKKKCLCENNCFPPITCTLYFPSILAYQIQDD